MVIVASQRLEPEGLGAHLLRKPETGRNLLKAVGGEERAGSWFYPSLWSPKPVLLPCNKFDWSPESKGPFPWHSLCDGSRTCSKMRDQHQTLGGESQEATAVPWQGDRGGLKEEESEEQRGGNWEINIAKVTQPGPDQIREGMKKGLDLSFQPLREGSLMVWGGWGWGEVSEEPEKSGRLPKNPAALQSSLHLWLLFVKDTYVAIIVLEKYTKKWYHSGPWEKNGWLADRGLSVVSPFQIYLWMMSHGHVISNSKIIRKRFSSCIENGRKEEIKQRSNGSFFLQKGRRAPWKCEGEGIVNRGPGVGGESSEAPRGSRVAREEEDV